MSRLRASVVQPAPAAHSKDVQSIKLLNVVQRRKQADRDVQLLQNRLQMLKKEEEKAIRKINNTKAKCSTILKIREENQRRAQERLRVLQEQREHVVKAKTSHYQSDEKALKLAEQRLKKIEDKKRQNVKEVREAKRFIKEDVTLQRTIDLQRKKEQRSAIKAAEEEARKIRELKNQKILEQARHQYEIRIKKEEEEALKREKEVLRMEKMEMELIQQLKNTQMKQKAALNDLETALQVES